MAAATVNGDRRVPEATVSRLPTYLAILLELSDTGTRTVSSDGLAQAAGVTSAQVRKDLSFLGTYGTRGVGYPVRDLLDHIGEVLGLDRDWPVVLVGVGNLGRALASYGGFAERGFEFVALFDADPAQVGGEVAGHRVAPLDDLELIVARQGVAIAVLAVPGEHAQEVADRLTAAGVTSILNFAPTRLEVPAGVRVRKVDVSTELQILAYHEQQRRTPARPPGLCIAPRAGQPG
ncbi:MAG: redox-sensing transcriptional repressor Rex [Actinobacteria bacterium]|nr:redox-sensing transcriptional repressor Rex [Actinomycetota bacterium]